MNDRIGKSFGSLHRRQRWKFFVFVVFVAVCFSVATAAFSYQAYLTINRYIKHDILQSSITTPNRSLSMPIVSLQFDTYRNTKTQFVKSLIEMKFDATLDNEKLPMWTFREFHDNSQHYITTNVINIDYIGENFTLEIAKLTVFH